MQKTSSSKLNSQPQIFTFVVGNDGLILESDQKISTQFLEQSSLQGKSLKDVLLEFNSDWETLFSHELCELSQPVFLPVKNLDSEKNTPGILGYTLSRLAYKNVHVFTLHSDLAPFEQMQDHALSDFEPNQNTIARLWLRLQTVENRLHNYMNHLPGIFFSQRVDMTFTYLGPGFFDLTQLSETKFQRSTNAYLNLIHEDDRSFFLDQLEASGSQNETFSMTYRWGPLEEDNIIHILDIRTPQISPTGLILGYEGVWLDVTRQAIAEKRLTSTAWKESVAAITSGLVHDFSNIMAGIYSISELFYSSLDEAHSWHEGIRQIKEHSMQAQKLVRRIVDLNRQESGRPELHNFETLLEDQKDMLKAVLPKSTRIEWEFSGREMPVYLDKVGFQQVIMNLVLNARDVIPQDNGFIKVESQHIDRGEEFFCGDQHGTVEAQHDGILLRFKDNGSGMEPEVMERIFHPFFTTKEVHKGSGLGLYNAKLFMDGCGGLIGVSSTIEEGTTFYLYLQTFDYSQQIYDDDELEDDDELYFKARPRFVAFSKKDPEKYDFIQLLRQKEWEVISFNSAQKTSDYLDETERLPHVIISVCQGHDANAVSSLFSFKQQYPFIKTVLYCVGVESKEFVEYPEECADLIIDRQCVIQKAVSQVAKLLT